MLDSPSFFLQGLTIKVLGQSRSLYSAPVTWKPACHFLLVTAHLVPHKAAEIYHPVRCRSFHCCCFSFLRSQVCWPHLEVPLWGFSRTHPHHHPGANSNPPNLCCCALSPQPVRWWPGLLLQKVNVQASIWDLTPCTTVKKVALQRFFANEQRFFHFDKLATTLGYDNSCHVD